MSVRPRRLFGTLAALGLALLLLLAVVIQVGRDGSPRASRTFEVDMQASAGTSAQIFWAGDMGFAEERSAHVPLPPARGGLQRLRFELPPNGIRWLRFDPTDTSGDILIAGLRLVDDNGHVIATFDTDSLRPSNQIASITRQGSLTKIVTTPSATDPSLLLAFGRVDRFSFLNDLAMITPVSLALISIAALALLSSCVVAIGRSAFEQGPDDIPGATPWRFRSALWLALLFLVVFWAKLLLIRDNPAPTPFYDQWDGEAAVIFVPYNENNLGWSTMFGFHNEHRVFFSRLLALGLLTVNGGQWDPRLEQVVNAAIHSFTAVLLTTILWVAGGRRRLDLLVLVAGLTFALPFGWENTLIGFQSAFYFLLLFSVLALWLTTAYPAGSGAWWLGWLCAICSLFTAASGVITPVAIAGVAALTLARNPRDWRNTAMTGAAAAMVLAFGIALASPPLAHHVVLKAQTIPVFVRALAQDLAWPWIDRPTLALPMWLPLAVALAGAFARRLQTTALERLAAGLGAWVLMNAVALAYGRGADAALPAIRYLDILSLGFVVNAVALMTLVDRVRSVTTARWIAVGTLAAWLLFAVVGVDRLVARALFDLSIWHQHFATETVTVRQFMMTDDVAWLLAKRPLLELPYPDPNRLVNLLQDPYIRRILPAAVRAPLPVAPRGGTSTGFVGDSIFTGNLTRDPLQHAWFSLSDEGKKAKGAFESEPLECRVGNQLTFQVSGYLGWPKQYLALRDLRTGRESAIVPDRIAGENWTDVVVPCPADPFAVVAIDDSEDSWFGFRAPVEVGRASIVTESLIQNSRSVLVALMTAAVLLGAVRWP